MKWVCAATLIIAALLALAVTMHVSHGGLHLRPFSFGVAQTELTLDSGQSPLVDSDAPILGVNEIASDWAELDSSPQVVRSVAAALHIRPSQISAATQLIQNVPLSQSDALEAQRGVQIIDSGRHYALLARVDEQTFVIQLFAQAPTGTEAVLMANTAAHALSAYAADLVHAERISKRKMIDIKQITHASGGTVDSDLGVEATILLAIVFSALGLTSVFTVSRWRRAL